MKNLVYLFALTALIFASSCQDDAETPIEPKDPEAELLAQLEINTQYLEGSVDKLKQELPSDKVYNLIETAPTKEDFIETMLDLSHELFTEHAAHTPKNKEWISVLDYNGKPMTQTAYLEKMALSGSTDPVMNISEASLELIKTRESRGSADVFIAQWKPTEKASPISYHLGHELLELLIQKLNGLGNARSEREEELYLVQIMDVLDQEEADPILVGLLLPAVQAARKGQAMELPQLDIVDWYGGIVEPVGGGLDRDIIRRIQSAAMLGSIHRAMSDGYDPEHPEKAQFQLYHAQYVAAVAAIADALYVDPQ